MREILFRGKRKDNGEWVEGCLLKVTIDGKTAYLIFGDNFSLVGGDVKALSHALVDPATVGQYTGLTDKNGKRIFEGDLVVPTNRRRLTNKPQVVEYNPLSGYWQCSPSREPIVIGNIHDNPELLEVEK